MSEIIGGGGEGRWKTGEGRSFLSPSKRRAMIKMTGKEWESQKNKPPRSWKDALIYIIFYKNTNHLRESWHAIISWHTVQPLLSGHSHLLVITMRVLFVVTSIKRPCLKHLILILWLYFKNTMKENIVRDRRWRVCAFGLCIMALGWCVMVLIIIRLQLAFILFCFAFLLPAFLWLDRVFGASLQVFSAETTFRRITFFAKLSDRSESVFASYSR